jgi:hypothetical protein
MKVKTCPRCKGAKPKGAVCALCHGDGMVAAHIEDKKGKGTHK